MSHRQSLSSFLRLVEKVTECGCWIWMGTTTGKTGYGLSKLSGRKCVAHVVSFLLHGGVIPDGYELDHKCRVTLCVNPDHLEPVTHIVNCQRAAVVRTHCKNGHPFAGDAADVRVDRKPNGQARRVCRVCDRQRMARFLERQRRTA